MTITLYSLSHFHLTFPLSFLTPVAFSWVMPLLYLTALLPLLASPTALPLWYFLLLTPPAAATLPPSYHLGTPFSFTTTAAVNYTVISLFSAILWGTAATTTFIQGSVRFASVCCGIRWAIVLGVWWFGLVGWFSVIAWALGLRVSLRCWLV